MPSVRFHPCGLAPRLLRRHAGTAAGLPLVQRVHLGDATSVPVHHADVVVVVVVVESRLDKKEVSRSLSGLVVRFVFSRTRFLHETVVCMAEQGAQKGGDDGATGAMPDGKIGSVQSPLIDQIGGPEAMASILVPAVEIFYLKLLGDPRISEFFAGVDTERLKNKQVEFMAFVFGSPERYTGKDIAQAHQRLIVEKGLNETHFDIVIDHFVATLKELNVPEVILDQAVAILLTSRPVFESRPTEEDKFKAAMNMLKECAHQKERALRTARGHLAQMGVTDRGQMELVRGAVKMRGGDLEVEEVLAGLIDDS